MLPAASALVTELDAEAPITRRVLARVPADRFSWQPHPKSLSAGQLAQHIATIPANMARMAQMDSIDMASRRLEYAPCDGPAALLETLDASVDAARRFLQGLDEPAASAIWRMRHGDRDLFAMPRISVARTIGLNHWYHHRGELVVYLRLMDVPVPTVYGPSADESPFPRM